MHRINAFSKRSFVNRLKSDSPIKLNFRFLTEPCSISLLELLVISRVRVIDLSANSVSNGRNGFGSEFYFRFRLSSKRSHKEMSNKKHSLKSFYQIFDQSVGSISHSVSNPDFRIIEIWVEGSDTGPKILFNVLGLQGLEFHLWVCWFMVTKMPSKRSNEPTMKISFTEFENNREIYLIQFRNEETLSHAIIFRLRRTARRKRFVGCKQFSSESWFVVNHETDLSQCVP